MKEMKTAQAVKPLSVKVRNVPIIKAPKFEAATSLKGVKIVQQISEKVRFVPVIKASTPSNGGDDDAAIKMARVAAIKAANLSNKNYNVGGSTSPATGTPASGIIFGGGGSSGGYASLEEGATRTGFSLSDIPTVVWIILAVAGGWFLIKSSKGKGKLF